MSQNEGIKKEVIGQFADDVETLLRALLDQIPGTTAQGSLREHVDKLADRAADISTGVERGSVDCFMFDGNALLEAIR